MAKLPLPPSQTDLAAEYARTARKAERLAKQAKSDAEREAFQKIGREWRTLEAVARGRKLR